MYLIINRAILPFFVGLVKKEKLIYLSFKENNDLLKIIAKFIKKNKIDLKNIQGIIVIPHCYSFTKLRTTLTLTNIFSQFLSIPISLVKEKEAKNIKEAIEIGKKRLKKEIIIPLYHKEPHIQMPKQL
ncbi:MAG: hypothetical protein ACK413_00055 [Patescibacteria group bacterium]